MKSHFVSCLLGGALLLTQGCSSSFHTSGFWNLPEVSPMPSELLYEGASPSEVLKILGRPTWTETVECPTGRYEKRTVYVWHYVDRWWDERALFGSWDVYFVGDGETAQSIRMKAWQLTGSSSESGDREVLRDSY